MIRKDLRDSDDDNMQSVLTQNNFQNQAENKKQDYNQIMQFSVYDADMVEISNPFVDLKVSDPVKSKVEG